MSYHRFFVGHVLDVLKTLPDESVHCVVTSPPYWGLRDYGLPSVSWPEIEYVPMPGLPPIRVPAWEGQLGLEQLPEMFVGHLVLIFREVRRVLRKDGTFWLNLGDSYAGSGGAHAEHHNNPGISNSWKRNGVPHYGALGMPQRYIAPTGLKEKDMVGIPWSVAFALQADGWWLRSEITWCKKAPLPESVKDRPTNATEKIFLFAKNKNYFYDYEAVREPSKGDYRNLSFTKGKTGAVKPNAGQGEREERLGRNMWNYWLLGSEPFPDAHFAVFPPEIPRKAILAGTSEKGCCPKCGAPWRRVLKKGDPLLCAWSAAGAVQYDIGIGGMRRAGLQEGSTLKHVVPTFTAGWRPSCSCGIEDTVPCTVLVPFGGAGTTTFVAMELGRDSIYIDLSREYVEIAMKRCGFGSTLLDCHSFELIEK